MRRLVNRVLQVLAMMLALLHVAWPVFAQSKTAEIVNQANRFLASLSPEQRKQVLYAYDDAAQRARWSNFPTGHVARGGISLKQMTSAQQTAAFDLLKAVLSPMGLEKVNQIRMADDDFKVNGSRKGPHGPPGGNGPPAIGQANGSANGHPGPPPGANGGRPFNPDTMFGKDLYFISFLGTPSNTAPWMLQFGGHHLALNITIAGNKGVMTPSLTGAQPATFELNGKTIRPVGRESDKALALLQSLDDNQRKQAILTYRVPDLVLGPGQDGKRIAPEGMKVSAMKESQKTLLLDLISEWVDIMNDSAASARMAQLKAELNEMWFAWSGPTDVKTGNNISAYYRIQGPHLVIEYAPQSDEPANHVHTIYRDPTNDYGEAIAHP